MKCDASATGDCCQVVIRTLCSITITLALSSVPLWAQGAGNAPPQAPLPTANAQYHPPTETMRLRWYVWDALGPTAFFRAGAGAGFSHHGIFS